MDEEDEAVAERVVAGLDVYNRVAGAHAGVVIVAATVFMLVAYPESSLHPLNNYRFGAFLLVLNCAGLYWLLTAWRPRYAVSRRLSARTDVSQQDVVWAGILAFMGAAVTGAWVLTGHLVLQLLLTGAALPAFVFGYYHFSSTDLDEKLLGDG